MIDTANLMKHIIISSLLILVFNFNGIGQPTPFRGTLLFNLSEKEYGAFLSIKELESRNIRLLSYDKNSEFTYDTIHKAFAFTTNGFEHKEFAITYKSDTVFITYPSLPFLSAVFIKAPIPLNGKSFSFSNKQIYDAIHSNKYYNEFRIFNLCQGCFITEYYAMPEEIEKQISKDIYIYIIKLKE
jgi:hypothetical protein